MDERISYYLLDLDEELKLIELDQANPVKKAKESINACEITITILKESINCHIFKSSEEEIRFFKVLKPQFYAKLYYFRMIQKYESGKPTGSEKTKRNYILKEQEKLTHYFDINTEFYTYYRNFSTHLDNKYFLRKNYDKNLIDDFFFYDADHQYCTSHDYKIARIIAIDNFEKYLDENLVLLDTIVTALSLPIVNVPKLNWTGSKVALIELVYALYSSKIFNDGKADIKEIIQSVEIAFNIKLGDYYHAFAEICERKKEETKFLDSIKTSLMDKIKFIKDK